MQIINKQIVNLLNAKFVEYNTPNFIAKDPIAIPHLFTIKQDIEIAAFFAATFAWGNRTSIINSCKRLLQLMDNSPYTFITQHQESDLKKLLGFVHRTFNTTDLLYFIAFLRTHYAQSSSLEDAFLIEEAMLKENTEMHLNNFYTYFFSLPDAPDRTKKHVSCPAKKSACKRLNMFLRWMVRDNVKGVDFGLWEKITPAQLIIPLDVHVGNVASRLGLLADAKSNWKNAVALTNLLKLIDPKDPVKFDFALFALGAEEKFR